jgi:HSP20 family molecular chaperone IbpA
MSSNLPAQGRGSQVQRRSGSIFSDLFGFDPLRSIYPGYGNNFAAFGMDISRNDDGYTVELPVPGFRPDQIDVSVQDDTLMISGKGDRRNFTRSLVLPEEIDADNISAVVDQGMLMLTLRVRPAVQPRRIPVQTRSADTVQTVSGESSTNGGSSTAGQPSTAKSTP